MEDDELDRELDYLDKMQKIQQRNAPYLGAALGLGLVVIGAFGWVVVSYFEAEAYENATGHPVSVWDAMFIELRVQAGPQDD